MTSTLITTNELNNMRVLGGKEGTKRIGKVRRFVFHPTERRCVGLVVKRPDLLWMFHRKDLFVSLNGFVIQDNTIVVKNQADATNQAACRALGVNWDACVLWIGLPVITEAGDTLGLVGTVAFDASSGEVHSLEVDTGATANALLGKRTIPADYILGFRCGMGAALSSMGDEAVAQEETLYGALLVNEKASLLATEGGAAEAAGQATAVAVGKVKETANKVKPAATKVAQQTGDAINKGAYATGKQIARSKTMFSDFKDEYDKARGPKPSKKSRQSQPAASIASKGASESCEQVATKVLLSQAAKGSQAKTTKPATKVTTATKATSQKKTQHKSQQKNMFAAFKEEFDKARKED